MSSYRCLHPSFLTQHIIFLQPLAGGHGQPAHTAQQTYWHHTDPTGGCRKLTKGWETCWTQYMFSVMAGDTLKDWPSDMSLLSPSASGYSLHTHGSHEALQVWHNQERLASLPLGKAMFMVSIMSWPEQDVRAHLFQKSNPSARWHHLEDMRLSPLPTTSVWTHSLR